MTSSSSILDPWYLENLICPVDGGPLIWDAGRSELVSQNGSRRYPVVDGIPVMLPADIAPTLEGINASREKIADGAPWYVDSVLLSDEQKKGILELAKQSSNIDPVAAYLVAATNGLGYVHLVGKLTQYPIPEIRLPDGNGKTLLDIGCSWGRWCSAAGHKGYQPIGIDPSLGAVMAARRVTQSLGIPARFIVGDARHLPLREGCIDTVFSYSVIQHFSVPDAIQTIAHVGRVLKPAGNCMIQMPTKFGIRCLINQARRGFRETHGFEVRYWSLADLRTTFGQHVGSAEFAVDCFFGIGWQPSDAHLMPPSLRAVIRASEALRALSRTVPLLTQVADSVYVLAAKTP